jgi:hypothetical protein
MSSTTTASTQKDPQKLREHSKQVTYTHSVAARRFLPNALAPGERHETRQPVKQTFLSASLQLITNGMVKSALARSKVNDMEDIPFKSARWPIGSKRGVLQWSISTSIHGLAKAAQRLDD